MYQKDLFIILEGKKKKPSSMSYDDLSLLDRKTLGTMRLFLGAMIAFNISKEKTTKDVMNKFTKLYEKPSSSNKVFPMKMLFSMQMIEGGSILDHLNYSNIITNQLHSIGLDFDDEIRALLILCSLLTRWNSLVMIISNSALNSKKLKFYDVVDILLSEYM